MPEINNRQRPRYLKQTFALADFVDGGGAAGTADFADDLPAGSLVSGWEAEAAVGFTGDTTAAIKVGVSGDDDRFSADTSGDIASNGDHVGSLAIAADAAKGISAAATPRVTVTGGVDFGAITAGEVTVTITYTNPRG